VPRNHSFLTEISEDEVLEKLLLLFVRDTEIETAKGEDQKYFYELDKEHWKMTVTTKERLLVDNEDVLGLGLDEEEKKDDEPEFVETVMEIVVLQDDDDENLRVVYFRKIKGELVVL